jgi:hypothetical protein
MANGSLTPYGGASRQGSVFPLCALYAKGMHRPSTAIPPEAGLLPGERHPSSFPFVVDETYCLISSAFLGMMLIFSFSWVDILKF